MAKRSIKGFLDADANDQTVLCKGGVDIFQYTRALKGSLLQMLIAHL